MTNSSRRRFLEISAGVAGRVAATGAVSLPILASMSKKAKASGWTGRNPPPGPGGNPHCFLRGTRILTPDGEIPIEDLTIGGLVETPGGPLPVKWIGRKGSGRTAPHGIGA